MVFKMIIYGVLCFCGGVFITAIISSIKVTYYHDAAVKWERLYRQLQEEIEDGSKQFTEE